MTDENKAISVNRWRLVLGGMSDKSLSFTGDKAEIITSKRRRMDNKSQNAFSKADRRCA